MDVALGVLLHQGEPLAAMGWAHGEDETPTGRELFLQRWGDFGGRGGDDDDVEGGGLGQAPPAVPFVDDHVFEPQCLQARTGLAGQFGDHFQAVHLPGQAGEDGRLPAGPGAHVQDLVPGAGFGQLGHEGDDEGLGDGLPVAEGEGRVVVGAGTMVVIDETLARGVGDGLADTWVQARHARFRRRLGQFPFHFGEHFQVMKDGCILANAGHFDVEIDIPALEDLASAKDQPRPHVTAYHLPDGRRLYLLCRGRLVNLAAAEGHPSAVMDMSFANQVLAVLHLAAHGREMPPAVHPQPPELDRQVAEEKLAASGIAIDTLTDEQRRYLASWREGT